MSETELYDPFPVMPPDLVHAIGMVAVQASRLENTTAVVMWSTVAADQLAVRRMPTTPDEFGAIVQSLHKVARTLAPDTGQRLRSWLQVAKNTMDQRNRVLHGWWGGAPNNRDQYMCQSMRRFKGRQSRPTTWWMTVEDVEHVANELAERLSELQQLMPDLVAELPHAGEYLRPGRNLPDDVAGKARPENFQGQPGPGLRMTKGPES
ncbi:hypothetical protein [Kineococcus radiotolerans]|uniref:Uncharacterized protein n=1 Tax=Kineococcus radiotolerans (strain ATCC BAA-149 / DSM 14245 / SRS30216) TaxID=266940 RepID=A6W8P2_KINRD|nr:hypothetical protein [Kineococcus radiotolerans]ABS03181.1 hypothetical protein Krad_1695 [Kineococcus radiotolerans SRS30216 = ATCC BAA-149]